MVPSRKMVRAHGGCLGTGSRRRTRQAAIVPGERHTRFDPGVSEWENPPGPTSWQPPPEHIRRGRATGGTETSKYPEEEKSNEIPRVAASESGDEPKPVHAVKPGGVAARGVVGPPIPGAPRPRGQLQSGGLAEDAWKGARNRVTAPYAKARTAWPGGTRVGPDT